MNNDILDALKDLNHNFHELTHTHKVIKAAISEIENLRKNCSQMQGGNDGDR